MAFFLSSQTSRAALRFFGPITHSAPRLQSAVRPSISAFRRYVSTTDEQPRLRLGSVAPNFKAKTTQGEIDFHQFIGDKWTVLFSHPADFTPVCTTELGAFSKVKPEFEKRSVQLIGLSADPVDSHQKWIEDINEVSATNVKFPIIADPDRKVAWLYDMVSAEDAKNPAIAFTIRSVFIIDPAKKIRLTMLYPASTGRNVAEVLRAIDALKKADAKGIATPVNWTEGDDVIVPPSVSTEQAKKQFQNVRVVKPYLRYAKV